MHEAIFVIPYGAILYAYGAQQMLTENTCSVRKLHKNNPGGKMQTTVVEQQ